MRTEISRFAYVLLAYFERSTLTGFQIGKYLFKTYRGLLGIHFDLFDAANEAKELIAQADGADDDHPIVLDEQKNCTAEELAAVLKFTLHSCVSLYLTISLHANRIPEQSSSRKCPSNNL